MENKEKTYKSNLKEPTDISSESCSYPPETALEMINAYGTYNIQPTALSDGDFPSIAQGLAEVNKPKPN